MFSPPISPKFMDFFIAESMRHSIPTSIMISYIKNVSAEIIVILFSRDVRHGNIIIGHARNAFAI